jgi:Domain of unknown function (DUF4265)
MRVQRVLDVFAQTSKSGRRVYEQVLVKQEGAHYRLVQSPGLVIGIAAGDLFDLAANDAPRVIERGGNVCVQVFSPDATALAPMLGARFAAIGGRLDGSTAKNLVYTVAVTAGFDAIEAIFAELDQVEWYYGNVYDPKDGKTPLNWWIDADTR